MDFKKTAGLLGRRRQRTVYRRCRGIWLVSRRPRLGDALLVAMLETTLWAVWFGEQVACWRDTRALNQRLRQFQEHA